MEQRLKNEAYEGEAVTGLRGARGGGGWLCCIIRCCRVVCRGIHGGQTMGHTYLCPSPCVWSRPLDLGIVDSADADDLAPVPHHADVVRMRTYGSVMKLVRVQ